MNYKEENVFRACLGGVRTKLSKARRKIRLKEEEESGNRKIKYNEPNLPSNFRSRQNVRIFFIWSGVKIFICFFTLSHCVPSLGHCYSYCSYRINRSYRSGVSGFYINVDAQFTIYKFFTGWILKYAACVLRLRRIRRNKWETKAIEK